ncbi:MAG: phosphate signaling complex protein PhoU [Actinomycetota bacterium]
MITIGESHTVRSFDEELDHLRKTVGKMGEQAERQLRESLQAMAAHDAEGAAKVIAADRDTDTFESEINAISVRCLALRQPMADDLRTLVTAFKISAEFERVADLAANIAKRGMWMHQALPLPALRNAVRLGEIVADRIAQVTAAYATCDADAAAEIWRTDTDIDELYSALFRSILTYMMEDPRLISASTHLLFVAKNLERCGDHATNIAEMIHYLCRGIPLYEARPKADTSIAT